MQELKKDSEEDRKGLPSFFKTWNQLYAFALGELALVILLMYWFTKYFE